MYSLRMIFFGATSFGQSLTIIQALTYRIFGLDGIKYELKYMCKYKVDTVTLLTSILTRTSRAKS